MICFPEFTCNSIFRSSLSRNRFINFSTRGISVFPFPFWLFALSLLQSIKECPWLAFFSLCAEQRFEEKEGIWRQLLIQLKKDPKIAIENALKVCITLLQLNNTLEPIMILYVYVHTWYMFLCRCWGNVCQNIIERCPLFKTQTQKLPVLNLSLRNKCPL